jgi:hypothetical protein
MPGPSTASGRNVPAPTEGDTPDEYLRHAGQATPGTPLGRLVPAPARLHRPPRQPPDGDLVNGWEAFLRRDELLAPDRLRVRARRLLARVRSLAREMVR